MVQFCSQLRHNYFGTTWIIFLTRLKSVWKLVSFKEWCLENGLCAKYASSKRMDIWRERRNRNIQYHTPTNCTSQAAMCLYAQRISDCCICSVRPYLLFLKIILILESIVIEIQNPRRDATFISRFAFYICHCTVFKAVNENSRNFLTK